MINIINLDRKCQKKIVFISDLHFDYTEETSNKNSQKFQRDFYKKFNVKLPQRDKHKFAPETSAKIQSDFIDYVKTNFENDILLLGGDFYDDFHKTLEFVKTMEQKCIFGFFVLGNHDYWNDGSLSHNDICSLFDSETKGHSYFRFLMTGKKYYVDDLCFIGDTGWTSFNRLEQRGSDKIVKIKSWDLFWSLPEAKLTRGFHPKKIRKLHRFWVDFANSVLEQEKKVIILTHNPMTDLTNGKDKDCWWSSTTKLLNTPNQIRIYGHTHRVSFRVGCNLTKQRGYVNKEVRENDLELYEEAKECCISGEKSRLYWSTIGKGPYIVFVKESGKWEKLDHIYINEDDIQAEVKYRLTQYEEEDFGILYKISDCRGLSYPFQSVMKKHFTTELVDDPNAQSVFSSSVTRCGYKRTSANKHNLARLARNKEEYLKEVKNVINANLDECYLNIGYYYYRGRAEQEALEVAKAAADYLENHDVEDGIRPFMTAAIITGYAWNGYVSLINEMRPVNDYDITRFFLVFLTMKKFKIRFDRVYGILRSKKEKIAFGNIELWLPEVNNNQLTVGEVMTALGQTPLIEYVNPEGLKYKIICKSCGHEWVKNYKATIYKCKYCTPKQIAAEKERRQQKSKNRVMS